MMQPSSTKTLGATVAVALLAAWSMVGFYTATEEAAGANADVYKIGDQASRFEDLVSALPASGIIGYISDVPGDQTLSAVLYGGLQYTLAPRLVTSQSVTPAPEWVIGDFSKPLDLVQFGKDHGLMLVKDFGNGAVLFRKQAR
jgi:hypothetical protein